MKLKSKTKSKVKPALHVVINLSRQVGDSIPKGSNPTKLHRSEAPAKAEAHRLAGAQPGESFGVFKFVGVATSAPVRLMWSSHSPKFVSAQTNSRCDRAPDS